MKNKTEYGHAPQLIGTFPIDVEEMMFYQYLPIKMRYEHEWVIPKRLKIFQPLIDQVIMNEFLIDKYVYITAKNIYVTPDNMGNRPGWHSDGFGTDDINYIWCNNYPTEFCIQPFILSDDHSLSLIEMEEQINTANIISYTRYQLLRLTESNIHRCTSINEGGMRAFVKISISKDRYNLIGNSHNHDMRYKWKMYAREVVRNHPQRKESDFIK